MDRRVAVSLLFAIALALPTLASAQGGKVPPLADVVDSAWANTSVWDDGRTEIATYDATRLLDGLPRPHTMRLLTVKEDLNKEYWTKADWPHGQKPVLSVVRQSMVATVEGRTCPHQFMSTTMFDRARISHAVKMSVSTQEWNGTTFKEFQLYQPTPVFQWHSYWDGEGTGTKPLPDHTANTYFEEELFAVVRAVRFKEGLEAQLMLEPAQVSTKAPIPVPSPARLVVERPTLAVTVPAGTYSAEKTWIVSVESDDGRRLEFTVSEQSLPNALVRFESSDGRKAGLKQLERRRI